MSRQFEKHILTKKCLLKLFKVRLDGLVVERKNAYIIEADMSMWCYFTAEVKWKCQNQIIHRFKTAVCLHFSY